VLRPIGATYGNDSYPNLLVGLNQPDDAAVWKLDDERALIVTTDFFTPVVDDPYDYGAIAAANSLSDIYAMGGQPFLALNVAALPPALPAEILAEIVRGGAETARSAGVVIAGGHTVQDSEPKFGLVALGFAHPDRLLTKAGARPGDRLLLTKPLGFGVTTTALKRSQAADEDVQEAVGWMKRLNREGAQLAVEFGLRGGTDITGYSLLGHAAEMAQASQVGLRFDVHRIPFISGARKYGEIGAFAGGAADNRLHFRPQVRLDAGIDEITEMLLFDPQTSGGLLLAVPPDRMEGLVARAADLHQPVWEVGEAQEGSGIDVV
jgi:selenide,water dikinase